MATVIGQSISKDQISRYSEHYRNKKRNTAITNAVAKAGIHGVSFNNQIIAKMPFKFSLELETMKATSQKNSGRCWMFAAMNILRYRIAKKCNIEQFELSGSYLAFWDKFERANTFLENILDTLDEPMDSRLLDWILSHCADDGGLWAFFVSLVEKYGLVPKDVMPENANSGDTWPLIKIMSEKLREYAIELRGMHAQGITVDEIRREKDRMLSEMYRLLCIFYGEPPTTFDFEYREKDKDKDKDKDKNKDKDKDKDKAFHSDRSLTPKDFFNRYAEISFDDYVVLTNYPSKGKPFNRTYAKKYCGNVIDGRKVFYFNTDMNTIKSLAVAQLKDKEPVLFTCDVVHQCDRETGIMDTELTRPELALDMTFGLNKAQRFDYRGSSSNHVMVFTGVNLIDDISNRWKVENSWGEDKGEKGFFVMGDKWFDEYVYRVVINRKHLPAELLPLMEQEPIEVEPWDPI